MPARIIALTTCWLLGLASLASAAEQLICCGAEEVFIIAVTRDTPTLQDRLWRWQASDSAEIPAELRKQFRTTDECKPYGETILITSSSGGVALIRRSDKKCLFHTSAKNAHSACLLPQDRVAVASSTGGDELLVFSLAKSGGDVPPLARLKLKGAHGALYDPSRQRIWVLGTDELLLVELTEQSGVLQLQVEKRFELPSSGGHDLSPGQDSRYLFVTTEAEVYQFDTREQKFVVFAPLAKTADVKSIAQHPKTGRIVYHQADITNKTWWSDRIRMLGPDQQIVLPKERLYKVRWDVAVDQP